MLGRSTTRKILIVEDDPYTQDLLQTAFEGLDFEVTLLPDADGDFVAKVEEADPDIISMDVMIGKEGSGAERNGFDALDLLQMTVGTNGIPVIIVSNFSQEERVERAKLLGAKDYLIASAYTPKSIAKQFLIYISDPKNYNPLHPLFKKQ